MLKKIERKVLGALLILSDEGMKSHFTMRELAHMMGYKEPGGALSFALQALELKNLIRRSNDGYIVTL